MTKRILLFAACAAAALVLCGCGNDTSQIKPIVDTVPPNPPVGIQVQEFDGYVRIYWDENAELDLAGYHVYKSSFKDGPFGKVSTRLLLCPWYFDDVSPADATFYKITAEDESGNESAFSITVGAFYSGPAKSEPSERQRP